MTLPGSHNQFALMNKARERLPVTERSTTVPRVHTRIRYKAAYSPAHSFSRSRGLASLATNAVCRRFRATVTHPRVQ
jgi:hypothetical protein